MRHIGDACRDTSLSVQNDLSACRRQKFFEHFGVERAPSTSLSVHNNISSCRRQNFFCLFGFERAPSAYLSVHNNISACCWQDFFAFLTLKGLCQPVSQYNCLRQAGFFCLFGFERAPSTITRQPISLFTIIWCLPQAGNFGPF